MTETKKPKNILLIVDDEEQLARATKRILDMQKKTWKFDEIHIAFNPAMAETILKNNPITAVLCDYNLGKEHPKGTDLAVKWKQEYPTIKTVIIFTGQNLNTVPKLPGIDAILSKANFTMPIY